MQRIIGGREEPMRSGLTWEERWNSVDQGLIACWEAGRNLRESMPELAARANAGELPPMGWKGGVVRPIQALKYGTLYYLAQWQGIRGEDLNIDSDEQVVIECTRTGVEVIFAKDLGIGEDD